MVVPAAIAVAVAVALLTALAAYLYVWRLDPGTAPMRAIGGEIRAGARAYLTSQSLRLALFIVVLGPILALLISPATAVAFAAGAVISAGTGVIGMLGATQANMRTAHAAANGGLETAFTTAFFGAVPLGLCIAGFGLAGVGLVTYSAGGDLAVLVGISLGASATALFARIGGGIFTKAADVGSDLVGKLEQGIPEDDPRNPGVIADNVGDNVGDVAGMGADLFESYVGSMVAAVTIAAGLGATLDAATAATLVVYPLVLAATGLAAALAGIALLPLARHLSAYRAVAVIDAFTQLVFVAGAAVVTYRLGLGVHLLGAVVAGNVAGFVIGRITTWYTSAAPVRAIVEASRTGAATNVIMGVALGFESCAAPLVVLAVTILAAHAAAGVLGIALAGVGMLATVGLTATIDCSGPIADNAGGIAEMAGLGADVREITDTLDTLGNTTAANGKGFAIGSAGLTALSLFFAYRTAVTAGGEPLALDLGDPRMLAGAFCGSAVVLLAASLTLRAVGAAAAAMVEEIRRQFRELPGILDGTARPDSRRCVRISTAAALDRMIAPALLGLLAPAVVGFALGPVALAGMLLGSLLVGVILAIFMADAGGAWDNAKKSIERGEVEGARRGDATHGAAVVGDTVGDPFKDTTGPAMNIMIKLTAIVALVLAPLLR